MAQPQEVPIPDAVLNVEGESCATLTPLTKAKLSTLLSGNVLEVYSDDPSAREGMAAWSRMTGNPLLAVVAEDANRTRFYLRKK